MVLSGKHVPTLLVQPFHSGQALLDFLLYVQPCKSPHTEGPESFKYGPSMLLIGFVELG